MKLLNQALVHTAYINPDTRIKTVLNHRHGMGTLYSVYKFIFPGHDFHISRKQWQKVAKMASFSILGKTNNWYKILCITPMVGCNGPKTAAISLL